MGYGRRAELGFVRRGVIDLCQLGLLRPIPPGRSNSNIEAFYALYVFEFPRRPFVGDLLNKATAYNLTVAFRHLVRKKGPGLSKP